MRFDAGDKWFQAVATVLFTSIPVAIVGAALWMGKQRREREQFDDEPPRRPVGFEFLERDCMTRDEQRQVELLDQQSGTSVAPDYDPQIGDVLMFFVDVEEKGATRRLPVVARALWPRVSYVRAVLPDSPWLVKALRLGPKAEIDVPRSAIGAVFHVIGGRGWDPSTA